MKNIIMKSPFRFRLSKPTEAFFKKSIKDIDKNSRDITCDYKYKKALGLAFANNSEEQAREYYHIICKSNVKYNKDKCDEEYTEYLKIKDNKTNLADFYRLYSKDLMIRYDEMVKAFEIENYPNKIYANDDVNVIKSIKLFKNEKT